MMVADHQASMVEDLIYVMVILYLCISVGLSVDVEGDYTCELLYKDWLSPDKLTVTWKLYDDDADDDDDDDEDGENNDLQANVTWYSGSNTGSCPQKTLTSCTWKYGGNSYFYMYGYFTLMVTISNKTNGLVVCNKTFEINPLDCTKPPIIDEFRVSVINSTCVSTIWAYSESSKCYMLDTKLYKLSYTTNMSFESLHLTNGSFNETTTSCKGSRLVCDLHPYTIYTFNIQTKWIDDGMNGYFSDDKKLTITTLQQAPSKAPDLLNDGWSVSKNTCKDNGRYTVRIFWKDVPESDKNGELLYFILSVSDGINEDDHQIPSRYYNSEINLNCLRDNRVKIRAVNSAGSSTWSNTITIPLYKQDSPDAIQNVIPIQISSKNVFQVHFIPRTNTRTYTIVWCIKHNINICLSPIQWNTVSHQDILKTIQLTPGINPYQYSIGVSTNNSAGIIWADCIYSDTEVSTPKNVNIDNDDKQSEGYMKVRWFNQHCSEALLQPYIKFFYIHICKVAAKYDEECQDIPETVVVDGSAEKYIFENLEPGGIYKVYIISEGLQGDTSSPSTPVYGQATQHDTSISTTLIVFVIIGCMIVLSGIVCCILAVKIRVCQRWKKFKKDHGKISTLSELLKNHDIREDMV